MWELITYYTPSYEDHYNRLKASCDRLNIEITAYVMPEAQTWELNCAMKPYIIRQAMWDSNADYVIWTDADSTVERYPDLFDTFNGTIGVFYRTFTDRHLCSGTMIFKVPEALPVVEKWIQEQKRNPEEWDQRTLQRVLKHEPHDIIPAAYCCVYDAIDMLEACNHQPVILHHQASRKVHDDRNRAKAAEKPWDGKKIRKKRKKG